LLNSKAYEIFLYGEREREKIMPEKEEPNKKVIQRNNFDIIISI